VLAVFEPAEDFGEGWLFAVHEDADAVDAAGEPEDGVDGDGHEDEGESQLPGWGHVEGDTEVHEQRGAEGDEGDDAGPEGAGVVDDDGDHDHAEGEGHDKEHVELLEFLLGVGHGSEGGGHAGVEQESEDEVEDEEDDLGDGDGEGHVAVGHGRGDGGGADESGGEHPDGDLGEAYGADAEDLAGHHLFGADGGEEDFKDAGGLLFDDGAGDVHAVEHDDHIHEEEEDEGDGGGGLGSVLPFLDGEGLGDGGDVAGAEAVMRELAAEQDGAECAGDGVADGSAAAGGGGVGEGEVVGVGRGVGGGDDPEVAVDGFVVEFLIEDAAGVVAGGRDYVGLEFAVFGGLEFFLEVEGEVRVGGDDGDVGAGGFAPAVEEGGAEDEDAHEDGDEHGGDDEGLGGDALEVFAAGDEPDVMHGRCLRLDSGGTCW
jgi:hypothetical protein